MLEFAGQELDLSMPEGREVKGRLGYLWVQAGLRRSEARRRKNAFLNLRYL